jgi:hypothetical protein
MVSSQNVQSDFLEWIKSLSMDLRGTVTQRAVRVSIEQVIEYFLAAFPQHNEDSTLDILRHFVELNPEFASGFYFDREKWRCLQMHQRL